MIKTSNPKEMKKWLEYSSIIAGVFFIILGLVKKDVTLGILGFFFILVVSNKTNILIDKEGLLIKTTTMYLFQRNRRLNFKEMDSVSINEGNDKALVYFMKGWKGRKVYIELKEIKNLLNFINKQKPQLIQK